MEKETLEDGNETEDFSVKNFVIQIIGCFLGLGATVGIHFGMNYLQRVTFANPKETFLVASFPEWCVFLY